MAAFVAGETFLVAYSRVGIMDGFLLFFMLATLLAALLVERKGQVLWVAVLLGLAISIKWAILMVAVPVGYILWRKELFRPFLASLWVSAVIYVAIVRSEERRVGKEGRSLGSPYHLTEYSVHNSPTAPTE